MKVKDLFEGVDPEAEIIFQMSDGCCAETFDLDEPLTDPGSYFDKEKGKEVVYCRVVFPALDFLTSCISSSIAQSAVKAHRAKLK